MKYISRLLVIFIFAAFLVAPALVVATPDTSFAKSAAAKKCEKEIIGIPTWFKGLSKFDAKGDCIIAGPGDSPDGSSTKLTLTSFIWRIVLNIIEIALRIVGFIAFFFIVYGGFQFLTGGSNPAQIEKARKTILNAVIGLVISLGAVAIINLVFGILTN